jgi:soluble lytic murein transglycosylase-like protein
MTAKSIIQVDIDPEGKFAAFYGLFQEYQKKLQDMPEDWAKVVDVLGDAGGEMEDFSKSSKHSQEFLMIAAIQADAITKAMQKAGGVQDKFNTKAKDGAKQMGLMARASKEMHKDISKMSGIYLKLAAIGGAVLGPPLAVWNATNALAGQNLQARGLGLRIGQSQAFSANFEKFGLGASDLGNIANAQGDVSKWRALISAGLTPQQIQNEDAEQLTYDFARAASGKYREWQKAGMPAASMAQAYGFTDFLSLQQLRTGASYGDQDWQRAQQKELIAAQKAAVDQGTADQASDVKASLKSDWAEVVNTFNDQLAKAGPELKTMGDAAAAAAINLIKVAGPEAKSLMDALENPGVVPANEGRVEKGLRTAGNWIRSHVLGLSITPSQVESATGLPSGMLGAQYQIESGGGKHLLSPKGAQGPLQFMPDTWKQWGNGGNINDLHDSMDAAGRYDAFLMRRYNGDVRKALAAYNWGMGHVDKDIAAHGDKWEQYSPQETQEYIKKALALMARAGQSVKINISNSTPSRVAVSMNAAPH